MEKGDLGTWVDNSVIVVLEGVLAQIPAPEVHKSGILHRTTETSWAPAETWGWSMMAIKVVNDKAHRLSLPIDVVTFLSEDVAEMAAEWFNRYAVAVSSCEYLDFTMFCEALKWRPNIHSVIDTDPDRLHRYGVKGVQTLWGRQF